MSKAYLYFTRPINEVTSNMLARTAFQVIAQTHCDNLVILMASTGGSINYGFDLYQQLRTMPAKITTVNIGSVESMGVIVFLAGDERYAVDSAKFKLHPFSWTFAGQTANYPELREAIDSLDSDAKIYSDIFSARTVEATAPIDIKRCLTMSPKILIAKDAISCGLIHGTISLNEAFFEAGAPRFFINP